jgi:hypothetical protein
MKTERISSKLWDNDAFTGLSDAAQLLYLRIYLSGSLSHLGMTVAPLSLWAPIHRPQQSITVETRRAALIELDEAGFTAYDQATDEILVVDYVRETGAWRSPKLVRVLPSAAATIRSKKIRTIMAAELLTLPMGELSTEPRKGRSTSNQQHDCWNGLAETYRVLSDLAFPSADTLTGDIDDVPSSAWAALLGIAERWMTTCYLRRYAPADDARVVVDLPAVKSR